MQPKKQKTGNIVKGKKSSWICFTTLERKKITQEQPGLTFAEIFKILKERWSSLCAAEKQVYVEMSNKDKDRYDLQMKSLTEEQKQLFKSIKKEKKKRRMEGPKAAISNFMYFVKMNREKIRQEEPTLTFKEIGQKLGVLWNAMTPDERAPYDELYRKDKERYQKELSIATPATQT